MVPGALSCFIMSHSPSGCIDFSSRDISQFSKGASVPNGANDGNTSETNVLQRTGSEDTSTDELYLLIVMQCVIL